MPSSEERRASTADRSHGELHEAAALHGGERAAPAFHEDDPRVPAAGGLDGLRLYDAMPGMHFVLDRSGTVLWVNPQGAAKLGYLPSELVGVDVLRFVHPDDRQMVARQLRAATDHPERMLRRDCRKIRKDGALLWVQETIRALDDDRGVPVLLLVSQDISARVAAKKRAVRYRRQVGTLTTALSLAEERERRRIASDLHDCVGQPLALAKLKLSALLAGAPSPDAAAGLADVRDQLDRAIRATRSLSFDLSSPVLHEVGFAPAVAELGERLAKICGLRFELDVDDAWKPLGQDAQVILYRIVEELLVNVVKHAGAKTVRVALRTAGDQIHITIEDDGVGVDPAALNAMPSRAKGLGLLSVRERLANLGGRMEISRAGAAGGTRVAVCTRAAICSWSGSDRGGLPRTAGAADNGGNRP